MKAFVGKTTLGVVLTVLSVVIALGQGGGSGNSQGAAILQRSCGSCHGLDVISNYHYESPAGYSDIINSMVAAGAQVSSEEAPLLAEYLFATYGKKPQSGAAPAAAPVAASNEAGRALLESACATCHGIDLLANHVYDTRDPYEGLIRNMIGYGATVTDAQIPMLVDYMLATYGKKPAAAPATTAAAMPDPGKAILESACTTCHGLEGLPNHTYTSKDPYEGLVRNMISYGAVVTDAQVTPLVDYMFKTYGRK